MSDNTAIVAGIAAGLLGLAALIGIPVHIVSSHGTERHSTCVENGGAYVHVHNTGYFECQKEN